MTYNTDDIQPSYTCLDRLIIKTKRNFEQKKAKPQRRDSRAAVNRQRGKNPKYVFTYKGERMRVLDDTGWVNARKRAGLAGTENTPGVRIHDLKHTLGRRLADAGIPFEQKRLCWVS